MIGKIAMTGKFKVQRDSSSTDYHGAGFQGPIKGASLADLVQMECLGGSERVIRVMSGSDVGFLYFRGGAVVHAVAKLLTGEAAAFEMLSWSEGTFEPIERERPSKESIGCTWQSLVLRAAQIHDESKRRSIVALRPEARGKADDEPEITVDSVEFDVTPIEIGGHVLRGEDFRLVLRVSSSGRVVVNRGSTEDFADVAAYAARLAELIGMLLGVERLVAMECVLKDGICFIALQDNGEVIALKPHSFVDQGAIRNLLGL
jgi:hypothetical protein